MQLAELFTEHRPTPDFNRFLMRNLKHGMPPLNTGKLAMDALLGNSRGISTPVPVDSDATLLLRYKNREGAVLSIGEQEGGEIWHIPQVQGAKSKVSYRVASGIHWAACLGQQTRTFAELPDAEVRYVTMPRLCDIENIIGSAALERVGQHYTAVKACFRMRWSKEHGLFVADIVR